MTAARFLRDPLAWSLGAFILLVLFMPASRPLFAALFPELERPLYTQDSFLALALSHLALVAASSAAAAALGVAGAIFVTRRAGAEFRGLVETLVAMGQSFPPVAVLAIAVPVIGFGAEPALIALTLYGILPVLENTLAGLGAVPATVRDAARGIGMGEGGCAFGHSAFNFAPARFAFSRKAANPLSVKGPSVVTPSIKPVAAQSAISLGSALSMNSFMAYSAGELGD